MPERLTTTPTRSGLQHIHDYGKECRFIRQLTEAIFKNLDDGKDRKVYNKALYDMCMQYPDKAMMLMDGEGVLSYRNHVRNKKGKLMSCEAYIGRNVMQEMPTKDYKLQE